jgi:hypothetical protein
MTIDSTTGLINWTPTVAGDSNVTVKVSDGDLFDSQSFTVKVSPLTCTLMVISDCIECYGTVYVDGSPTRWIDVYGTFTITWLTPGTTVAVYIVDGAGWPSHTEFIDLAAGNNYVTFTGWW